MAEGVGTFKYYLDNSLKDFPKDLLAQKAAVLVDQCINHLNKKLDLKRGFNLLAKLLSTYSGLQDFKTSIINRIQKIIHICISVYSVSDVESSLDCLEVILVNYGNASYLCKSKISDYLEKFLCSTAKIQTVTKAGNAYHLLQQVGSAGKNGDIHKRQWFDYVQALCKTMNLLFDIFFENTQEYIISKNELAGIAFQSVMGVDFENKNIAQKLRNVIIFLKCALLKQYPVEKSLPFESIFYCIKRGLAVDEYSNDSINEEFLCLLYTLQINLLHLLQALIICASPGIRKYSEEILKLVTDCLKRTEKIYFKDKSIYHRALYENVNSCINLEKENLNSSVCDTLLTHILNDISNVSNPISETARNEEIVQTKELQINNTIMRLTATNTKCKDAIYTGVNLLRNAVLIKENKLNALYRFATDQLFSIRNGHSVEPYPKYVTDLYKLLNVLRNVPSFASVPLIHGTLHMLANDQKNQYEEACLQGLEAIENLVNPIYPSLTILKTDLMARNENTVANRNINSDIFSHFETTAFDKSSLPQNNDKMTISMGIEYNETKVVSCKDASNIITVSNDEPPLKRPRIINEIPNKEDEHAILLDNNTDCIQNSMENKNNEPIDEKTNLMLIVNNNTDKNKTSDINLESSNTSPAGGPDLYCKENDISDVSTLLKEKIAPTKEATNSSCSVLDEDNFEIPDSFRDIPNEFFLDI